MSNTEVALSYLRIAMHLDKLNEVLGKENVKLLIDNGNELKIEAGNMQVFKPTIKGSGTREQCITRLTKDNVMELVIKEMDKKNAREAWRDTCATVEGIRMIHKCQ